MNRREFNRVTLGAVAVGMVTPLAAAETVRRQSVPRTIIDSVIIDFAKSEKSWRRLNEPDERGRTFVYEETGETEACRHFEFLRNDGLVIGRSSPLEQWTVNYQTLEGEFESLSMVPGARPFGRDEFRQYVSQLRDDLNGWEVPIHALA